MCTALALEFVANTALRLDLKFGVLLLVELISTFGIAIIACSAWVIVSGFWSALYRDFMKLIASKTEEEWAWWGFPVGGAILLAALILHVGLKIVDGGDNCIVANDDGDQIYEFSGEYCSALRGGG